MGHYAKVIDNIVTEVIVADQAFIDTLSDKELWLKTSYNTSGGVHYNPETGLPDDKPAIRKNYAGVGFSYDVDLDAFIPPQPYPSWLLNTQTGLWEPPIPYPNDGKAYDWDEETKAWVLSNDN